MKTPAQRSITSIQPGQAGPGRSALQRRADHSGVVTRLAGMAHAAQASKPVQRMTIAAGGRVDNKYVPGFFTTGDFDDNHLIVGNPSRRSSENVAVGRAGVFRNTLVNKAQFQLAALAKRALIKANTCQDKVTALDLPDGAARDVRLRNDRTVKSNKKIGKIGVQGFKRGSGVVVVNHMTKAP